MSDAVKEIILETAEKNGWLEDKFVDKNTIAKKLLSLGVSIEKVAEATGFTLKELEQLQIA